jgi:hypothetical protein
MSRDIEEGMGGKGVEAQIKIEISPAGHKDSPVNGTSAPVFRLMSDS